MYDAAIVMHTLPPILDPNDVVSCLFEDMRDASRIYWNNYGHTRAFDSFVNHPASAAVIAELLCGDGSPVLGLQCMRDGFLGQWGSARSMTETNVSGMSNGVKVAAGILGQLRIDATLESLTITDMEGIVAAFETLDSCKGVGATIASKMIAALRPAIAVMWDMPIAAKYGFAHSTTGYRRFLRLMRDTAARIRAVSNQPDLEAYLQPYGRAWKAPLAKVLDEWHWVRITRKHVYDPQTRMN